MYSRASTVSAKYMRAISTGRAPMFFRSVAQSPPNKIEIHQNELNCTDRSHPDKVSLPALGKVHVTKGGLSEEWMNLCMNLNPTSLVDIRSSYSASLGV